MPSNFTKSTNQNSNQTSAWTDESARAAIDRYNDEPLFQKRVFSRETGSVETYMNYLEAQGAQDGAEYQRLAKLTAEKEDATNYLATKRAAGRVAVDNTAKAEPAHRERHAGRSVGTVDASINLSTDAYSSEDAVAHDVEERQVAQAYVDRHNS